MILVDILSIAEFILPPPYTLEHKTPSDKSSAVILATAAPPHPRLSRLTPCRQYEPLRNSLISWSSVRREMWVVPTATWACPGTVMGLWVDASSFTGDASSWNKRAASRCQQKPTLPFSRSSPLCSLLWSRRAVLAVLLVPCPAGWDAEAWGGSPPETGRRWSSPERPWTCNAHGNVSFRGMTWGSLI